MFEIEEKYLKDFNENGVNILIKGAAFDTLFETAYKSKLEECKEVYKTQKYKKAKEQYEQALESWEKDAKNQDKKKLVETRSKEYLDNYKQYLFPYRNNYNNEITYKEYSSRSESYFAKLQSAADVILVKDKRTPPFDDKSFDAQNASYNSNCEFKPIKLFETQYDEKSRKEREEKKEVMIDVTFGNRQNFGGFANCSRETEGAQEEKKVHLPNSKEEVVLTYFHNQEDEKRKKFFDLTLGEKDIEPLGGRPILLQKPAKGVNDLLIAAPRLDGNCGRPNRDTQETADYLFFTFLRAAELCKRNFVGKNIIIRSGLWGAGVFHNNANLSMAMQIYAAAVASVKLELSSLFDPQTIEIFKKEYLPTVQKIIADTTKTNKQKREAIFSLCCRKEKSNFVPIDRPAMVSSPAKNPKQGWVLSEKNLTDNALLEETKSKGFAYFISCSDKWRRMLVVPAHGMIYSGIQQEKANLPQGGIENNSNTQEIIVSQAPQINKQNAYNKLEKIFTEIINKWVEQNKLNSSSFKDPRGYKFWDLYIPLISESPVRRDKDLSDEEYYKIFLNALNAVIVKILYEKKITEEQVKLIKIAPTDNKELESFKQQLHQVVVQRSVLPILPTFRQPVVPTRAVTQPVSASSSSDSKYAKGENHLTADNITDTATQDKNKDGIIQFIKNDALVEHSVIVDAAGTGFLGNQNLLANSNRLSKSVAGISAQIYSFLAQEKVDWRPSNNDSLVNNKEKAVFNDKVFNKSNNKIAVIHTIGPRAHGETKETFKTLLAEALRQTIFEWQNNDAIKDRMLYIPTISSGIFGGVTQFQENYYKIFIEALNEAISKCIEDDIINKQNKAGVISKIKIAPYSQWEVDLFKKYTKPSLIQPAIVGQAPSSLKTQNSYDEDDDGYYDGGYEELSSSVAKDISQKTPSSHPSPSNVGKANEPLSEIAIISDILVGKEVKQDIFWKFSEAIVSQDAIACPKFAYQGIGVKAELVNFNDKEALKITEIFAKQAPRFKKIDNPNLLLTSEQTDNELLNKYITHIVDYDKNNNLKNVEIAEYIKNWGIEKIAEMFHKNSMPGLQFVVSDSQGGSNVYTVEPNTKNVFITKECDAARQKLSSKGISGDLYNPKEYGLEGALCNYKSFNKSLQQVRVS